MSNRVKVKKKGVPEGAGEWVDGELGREIERVKGFRERLEELGKSGAEGEAFWDEVAEVVESVKPKEHRHEKALTTTVARTPRDSR